MTDSLMTPMLRQYESIKAQHRDKLVFFRLGDFYELFNEDAEIAARELEITLTSREAGKGKRMPMCGVPYHAADSYIGRLVTKGYKVAICEQMEDPKLAKGVVRREVVRIITPGTVMEPALLEAKSNNYLASVFSDGRDVGIALCDLSTGEFLATEVRGDFSHERAVTEIVRRGPRECLVPDNVGPGDPVRSRLSSVPGINISLYDAEAFRPERAREYLLRHFRVASLEAFGCERLPLAIGAAGACISYLSGTQGSLLAHVGRLRTYTIDGFMAIDETTQRNLEIFASLRDGTKKGSLLGVLDRTITGMGGRLLRRWLEEPLLDLAEIRRRQDLVERFFDDQVLRNSVRDLLKGIYDIERLTARAAMKLANPREIYTLGLSLERLPELWQVLAGWPVRGDGSAIDCLEDIAREIRQTLVDDPPTSPKEGGIIRPGFDETLDRLREARSSGRAWLVELESRERERTGIKSLKVGYNQVFGYYIEVTRPNLPLVPPDYIRKQTLASGERFITPELKEKEVLITRAEEEQLQLEYELFCRLRDRVAGEASRLQKAAALVAEVDVASALAEVARLNNYVRPEVTSGDEILVKAARHPVVEQSLKGSVYVPNDIMLDGSRNQIAIITGPNMAGKSTYMRSCALIVIMAQIGSFVPAESARIGIVSRIMTRIGATDDLALGLSTFMVEMLELARILIHADRRTLILLDEVGRGTGTLDGLSIARATVEYIHDRRKVGAKTLFATHFHQLTSLEKALPRVKNYCMTARQEGQDIVFLHKIEPGSSTESYGIDVARLAGLPPEVIKRASEILAELKKEGEGQSPPQKRHARGQVPSTCKHAAQLSLFEKAEDAVIRDLLEMDLLNMTPLEALARLKELQERLKEGTLGIRVIPGRVGDARV
ncbi:MAG TPA: DNA mismatch repair protein MutS [Firmicutes bacterium]|nr:DNA mismatch repair protein MutS [Bacillota bacterium]